MISLVLLHPLALKRDGPGALCGPAADIQPLAAAAAAAAARWSKQLAMVRWIDQLKLKPSWKHFKAELLCMFFEVKLIGLILFFEKNGTLPLMQRPPLAFVHIYILASYYLLVCC